MNNQFIIFKNKCGKKSVQRVGQIRTIEPIFDPCSGEEHSVIHLTVGEGRLHSTSTVDELIGQLEQLGLAADR